MGSHSQEAEPAAQTALNTSTVQLSLLSILLCDGLSTCKEKRSSVQKKLGNGTNLEFRVSSDPGCDVNPGCAPAMATCKPVEHRSTACHLPHCAYSSSLPPSLYIPKAIKFRECGSHTTLLLLLMLLPMLLLISCCCFTSTSTICMYCQLIKGKAEHNVSPPSLSLRLPLSTPHYHIRWQLLQDHARRFSSLWEWPPIIWVGKITDQVATLPCLPSQRGDLRLRCSGSAGNSMQ